MINDVEAFRAAWNAASAIEASERPNAPILAALDRLAEGVVSRVAHGSTVEAALKPYLAALKKNGDATSDPASLDATAFRDGDRWLIDVRMGYASSVSAFDRKGRLAVPPELRWSYRQFGPFFRSGPLVAFDATSLSDAGTRYTYRLGWLRRTSQGYVAAGRAEGTWTYESSESQLVARGSRVTLASLDAPRSFFTANPTRVMRRTETWESKAGGAKRVRTTLRDLDVRAADDWLVAHQGTRLGRGFVVAKDNGMANDVRRGKGWLELDLEGSALRFELGRAGGKTIVRRVTVR